MKYGMSEELGPLVYATSDSEVFMGKEMGHGKSYSTGNNLSS